MISSELAPPARRIAAAQAGTTQAIRTGGRAVTNLSDIARRFGPDKTALCQRHASWILDENTTAAIMAGASPGDLVLHLWDSSDDSILEAKSLVGFRGVYRPRSARGVFLFFAPIQASHS